MDLDIIRKIKLKHNKGRFDTLKLKQKFFLIVFLFSLMATLVPHIMYANTPIIDRADPGPVLVFNLSDTGYNDYLEMRGQELSDQYYLEQIHQQAVHLQRLTEKVQDYLSAQGSPLTEYANTLVTLRNWKMIVALANAESSMCRHYPTTKANCWGVGGANLWDMGNNLGDGIISMNRFLNTYPLGSPIKYSQMSFAQMNGLYKQPPADHWVNNNQAVYQDLSSIEDNL